MATPGSWQVAGTTGIGSRGCAGAGSGSGAVSGSGPGRGPGVRLASEAPETAEAAEGEEAEDAEDAEEKIPVSQNGSSLNKNSNAPAEPPSRDPATGTGARR
ncbi:hypothetical protein K6I34_007319, partial [Streptomyces sp. UNOC14_S4]|nr:hypothetical protein [Streptomyces sp. UNOC14_S4]